MQLPAVKNMQHNMYLSTRVIIYLHYVQFFLSRTPSIHIVAGVDLGGLKGLPEHPQNIQRLKNTKRSF